MIRQTQKPPSMERLIKGLVGWLAALAMCLLIVPDAIAQENVEPAKGKPTGVTVELPRLAVTDVSTVVFVPDGGKTHWDARAGAKRQTSYQILASYQSNKLPKSLQFHFCTKSESAGATTYDIIHDSKPLKIVTHESGKIEMRLVRHYSNDNLDALQQDHPEIAMHINALPKELSEYAKVKLSLDVESDVSVNTLLELKEEHPSLFKIYQRWVVAGEK